MFSFSSPEYSPSISSNVISKGFSTNKELFSKSKSRLDWCTKDEVLEFFLADFFYRFLNNLVDLKLEEDMKSCAPW